MDDEHDEDGDAKKISGFEGVLMDFMNNEIKYLR